MKTELNGTERVIKYRRVPGYYNRSTYHVDIDHQHVMTVQRTGDSTWNRSAVWSAYRPGVNWSLSTIGEHGRDARAAKQALFLTTGSTRELAVEAALRKLAREETAG